MVEIPEKVDSVAELLFDFPYIPVTMMVSSVLYPCSMHSQIRAGSRPARCVSCPVALMRETWS